jgi:YD repeat-containing protein
MAFLDESERKRQMEEAEEEARRKRQVGRLRRIAAVLAGLCLASVAGIILVLYGWFFEHEAYYNTQIERWGIPEGYGPLSKDQVRRRDASLKFVSKGWFGDVLSIEAVDSQGNCTHRHSIDTHFERSSFFQASPLRECRWEFLRDQNGHIAYQKAYNKFGELVWGFLYVPTAENRRPERQRPIWQTSVEKPQERQAYFVGPDGFPQSRKNARADVVRFSYSEKVDEVRVTYWTRDNKQPATGPDHAYGKEREFYQNGLVKRSTSLDAAGRPMNDTEGNATITLVYDELGNARELEASDKNGAPVNVKLGYHRVEVKRDENSNPVEIKLFGKNKSPVLAKDGFHHKRLAYNNRGHLAEERFFDTYSQPAIVKDGFHHSKMEWDERGNPVQVSFFGKQGQPVISKDGYHRVAIRYHDRGNQSENAFYDAQQRPTYHKDGFHRTAAVYDDRGNAIEERYFDTQGHPVMTKDGYHRSTARYDDRRNVTEQAFYGVQDQPTNHKEG